MPEAVESADGHVGCSLLIHEHVAPFVTSTGEQPAFAIEVDVEIERIFIQLIPQGVVQAIDQPRVFRTQKNLVVNIDHAVRLTVGAAQVGYDHPARQERGLRGRRLLPGLQQAQADGAMFRAQGAISSLPGLWRPPRKMFYPAVAVVREREGAGPFKVPFREVHRIDGDFKALAAGYADIVVNGEHFVVRGQGAGGEQIGYPPVEIFGAQAEAVVEESGVEADIHLGGGFPGEVGIAQLAGIDRCAQVPVKP